MLDSKRNDLELVESVVATATGRTMGGELTFVYPGVLEAIGLCTTNAIAVLGVELFIALEQGYRKEALSTYEVNRADNAWQDFVRINNDLADHFVRENPAGDDHFYLLTTMS